MGGTQKSQRCHKPKCSVWQYWESEVTTEGVNLVRCMFCSHEYTGSVAKNATRLRQHITRRCNRAPDSVKMSFPEEADERNKTKITETEKSDDNSDRTRRPKRTKRSETVIPEVKSESDDDLSEDEISISSEAQRERTKDVKSLEEENQKLSSKLKICLEQKEALLQINKYLDQSLSLMFKLDSLHKNYSQQNESKIEELTQELDSCTDSVKSWKEKYNLIEFKQKMKTMYKTSSGLNPSTETPSQSRSRKWCIDRNVHIGKGHRPQSTIWKYFTIRSKESDKSKTIKCNFCEKEFRYKHLNATKCRTHIVENCDSVPEDIRRDENNWIEYRPQSKVDIWQHFTVTEKDNKTTVECNYCNHLFYYRNATKCRSHLVGKCDQIPQHIRDTISGQCDEEFVTNSQVTPKTKLSNIWRHFDIEEEDGKTSCVCIYCRHYFSYKNATKSRNHLMNRCPAIPLDVRLDISSEAEEYCRTWTQTRIPIWDYFESETIRGKECSRCIYCGYIYGHKNTTKLRIHLLSKCEEISDESRELIREKCEKSFLSGIQNKSELKIVSKKSKDPKIRKVYKKRDPECKGAGGRKKFDFIWEHFIDRTTNGSPVLIECKFCNQTFNYRNATKMRHHLANSCKTLPSEVRNRIKDLNLTPSGTYKRRVGPVSGMHECCWPGCDLKFTKLSRLKVHQLLHMGGVQRIRCDWPGCEWSGRSKSDVKIHRCIHTGEKPYACDWPGCDFRTAKPSSIWIHKRRHKELFKYQCDWPGCERRFLTSWERKRHKNTHLGLKPFGCQYCEKRYPMAYKLKVHQNKHHLNRMQL